MKIRLLPSLLASSSSRQFLKGTGAAFLITTAGKGIAYVVQLVLARLLGVESYGVYIYVLTIVYMLSIFSTMGFDSGLLKYLALYRSREQWSLFSGMVRRSVQIPLVLSVCTALAVILVASAVDRIAANHALYSTLIVGSIALPFFTSLKILQAIYRSQKKITLALFPNEIAIPLLLVIGVGLVGILNVFPLSSLNVMAYHAAVLTGMLALFAFICFRQFSGLFDVTEPPVYKTGEWLRTAGSLLLISGMHIILAQTDIMLLGVFRGTTDAGIYSIAVKIAILVAFGLQIGNQIIAPMISEFYHAGDEDKLQEVVSYGTFISTIFAVSVVLAIAVFADRLLLLFGKDFTAGKIALYVLAGGQLINALMGPVGFIMTMTRHHREASIIISVSAVVNIMLNFLLIPRYGMTGAAVATSVTMLGWNIAFWLYIRKHIGINTLVSSFFARSFHE